MSIYHETKNRGIMNIQKAMTGLIMSDDHEDNKTLLHAIIETCKLMLWTEDIQIAYETGDIEYLLRQQDNKYD